LYYLLFLSRSYCEVTEPNGMIVPVNAMNGEIQLFTFFEKVKQTQGSIDWISDAEVTSSAFFPVADLEITLALKQTPSQYGLGWFNVLPDMTSAPNTTAVYEIFSKESDMNDSITLLDIKNNPNYKGGLIGFSLLSSNQPKYLPDNLKVNCTECIRPSPWIMALVYAVPKVPEAYYICFEDGEANRNQFGNDGDFNDYVYYVQHLEKEIPGSAKVMAVLSRSSETNGTLASNSSEYMNSTTGLPYYFAQSSSADTESATVTAILIPFSAVIFCLVVVIELSRMRRGLSEKEDTKRPEE